MSEFKNLSTEGWALMADVLDSLPTLLYKTRRDRGLSARAAAREMGISFATVSRIEMRRDFMVSSALVVLRWIGSYHE